MDRAVAHLKQGQRREALPYLRRACQLRPAWPEACFELGVALQELGQTDEALLWFERATRLLPEHGMMQFRFADALWANRETARAITHYQAALAVMPQAVELLSDLSRALHAAGQFEAAVVMSQRALALDSSSVEARLHLGRSLLELERLGEALDALRAVLRVAPTNLDALLGFSSAAFRAGMVKEVVPRLRAALAQAPSAALHSNLVFAAAFHPELSTDEVLAEALAWAKTYAEPLSLPVRTHTNDRSASRKLRIGYVSPDFWDHVLSLFMRPVFRAHDREQVEVVCYSSVARPDSVTAELRGLADVWHDVRALDDAALAERIRADKIDVLVDMTMHMADNRLQTFARRPAPVQVAWLAYPGTTGLTQMDYRITDRHLDPPVEPLGEGDFPVIAKLAGYSEQSLILRDTFWCYDACVQDKPVSPLPASNRGFITFGCLNNLAKVSEGVVELWARVLGAVPGSHMLLRAPAGEPRRLALETFAAAGVAADRVHFVERLSRTAYLDQYASIDVCLDTFPYNGHTTSLDSLWMGVPVVTLVGKTVVGRAGLCHARNLGLDELVAQTPDELVARAVALTADLDRLAKLRAELRARLAASPLMDAPRFARQLEQGYRLAWRTWCAEPATSTCSWP